MTLKFKFLLAFTLLLIGKICIGQDFPSFEIGKSVNGRNFEYVFNENKSRLIAGEESWDNKITFISIDLCSGKQALIHYEFEKRDEVTDLKGAFKDSTFYFAAATYNKFADEHKLHLFTFQEGDGLKTCVKESFIVQKWLKVRNWDVGITPCDTSVAMHIRTRESVLLFYLSSEHKAKGRLHNLTDVSTRLVQTSETRILFSQGHLHFIEEGMYPSNVTKISGLGGVRYRQTSYLNSQDFVLHDIYKDRWLLFSKRGSSSNDVILVKNQNPSKSFYIENEDKSLDFLSGKLVCDDSSCYSFFSLSDGVAHENVSEHLFYQYKDSLVVFSNFKSGDRHGSGNWWAGSQGSISSDCTNYLFRENMRSGGSSLEFLSPLHDLHDSMINEAFTTTPFALKTESEIITAKEEFFQVNIDTLRFEPKEVERIKTNLTDRLSTPVIKDTSVCKEVNFSLENYHCDVSWSTGSKAKDILLDSSGVYWVEFNEDGCISTDTFELNVINDVFTAWPDSIFICDGENPITAFDSTENYILNAVGDTLQGRNAYEFSTGWYSLISKNSSCKLSKNFYVDVVEKESFPKDTMVACNNDTALFLFEEKEKFQYKRPIFTHNDSVSVKLPIGNAGQIILNWNKGRCFLKDTVFWRRTSKPSLKLDLDTQKWCMHDSILLSAKVSNTRGDSIPEQIYWSNGAVGEVVKNGLKQIEESYSFHIETHCGILYSNTIFTHDLHGDNSGVDFYILPKLEKYPNRRDYYITRTGASTGFVWKFDSSKVEMKGDGLIRFIDTGLVCLSLYAEQAFCIDSIQRCYQVYEEDIPLYWPTAISPNNDGVNDVWSAPSGIEVLKIRVFNRWGQIIASQRMKSNWSPKSIDHDKNGTNVFLLHITFLMPNGSENSVVVPVTVIY